MKLNLPKEYLSYSQMDLWMKNREAYRQRYYLNGPSFENTETIFGKKIATWLEKGISEPTLDRVPKYKFPEHRIELKVNGVSFLGVMDSFSKHFKKILEYKTGKIPWTQQKVNKHGQLVVYSLLTKLKYGKVNPVVKLVWIETRYKISLDTIGSREMLCESNELEFTGKIETFKRRISERERREMSELIERVAKEISEDYTNFQRSQNNSTNI